MTRTRKELLEALEECVSCGRCLAECPLYKITGREGSSARGKLALLKAELGGEVDLARRMKDLLSYCLMCGACAESCVNEVKGDELIQAGRTLAVKNRGLPGIKRLLARDVMSHGSLSRAALASRSLWLKNVPPESGLHFRFPLPGLNPDRWLPPLAPQPFLDAPPETIQPSGSGPRVALFAGCVANYLHPETALAAVRVLEAAGARVFIPREQVCCGKPALGSGDTKTADFLARKNLAAFESEEFDYIAAFCATCSAQLKEYAHRKDLPAGKNWANRVRDMNELLVNDLHWRPQTGQADKKAEPLRVFYHDPCHLHRKQGIIEEPRALIRSLPGVELLGADQPPVCCGYGGLFNLWHYSLSQDVLHNRTETIAPFEPDVIVTACSGCLLQFEDGIRRQGLDTKISSLVELIASRDLNEPAS
ncbi:MAG: (Fe-S)-binding protein [Deltaproteobacteria bacterium]|nr:(Fe-S)-binding protein [Deltaproteobacteria bacterium]MBW2053634.1 (Fe-S)-binding protein [Deltaproteobacteria bacterium]MBW2142530.1 (Fe-S)-binding protein [Deltaproteobacteria bacterium]MBW2324393.1 (Fe-S)-binding protein [Deltaproteobacteria bacterium]